MYGKKWANGTPSEETGICPVWPLDDLREHDLDSLACACRPQMRGGVLVHNAFDGRECLEVKLVSN